MLKKILKSNILKQFAGFGLGPIAGMFISFLTVPVTTRLLLPEEFGKTSLFTLVTSIFSIIAFLGLDQSYVRFYNIKDYSKQKILFNSFTIPFLITILLGIVSISFMHPISIWMYGSYEPVLMLLFFPFLIFTLIERYAFLSIRMQLKGTLYSTLTIFTQFLSFILLIILLLFYGKSFRSIILSSYISMFIRSFIVLWLTRHDWKFSKVLYDKNLQTDMLKFALPLIPATIISWLLHSFDKIAIRQWSTYEELGLYAAAYKFVSLVAVFQVIFTTSWVPIAYKWFEEKKDKRYFDLITNVVTVIMSLIYVFIVISRDIVYLFLGEAYRNSSSVFIFLLFMPVMYTISEAATIGISLMKKTVYSLYATIVSAVINLILNYLLVPTMGATGAAIGTCASYIAFFWLRVIFACKVWYKISLSSNYINSICMIILLFCVYYKLPKYCELLIGLGTLIINIPFMISIIKRLNIPGNEVIKNDRFINNWTN
jgi:O-antigen/teichoic acid export membrane protein